MQDNQKIYRKDYLTERKNLLRIVKMSDLIKNIQFTDNDEQVYYDSLVKIYFNHYVVDDNKLLLFDKNNENIATFYTKEIKR